MAHVPVHSSVLPMLFGCLLLLAGYSYGLRAVVVPSANQMRQYFTESYIRMADRAVAARPSILVLVDSCSQRFGMPGFSRVVGKTTLTTLKSFLPAFPNSYHLSVHWAQLQDTFSLELPITAVYGEMSTLHFCLAAGLLCLHFMVCCSASVNVIRRTGIVTNCFFAGLGLVRYAFQLGAQCFPIPALLSFKDISAAYWPCAVFLWAAFACCWAVTMMAMPEYETKQVVDRPPNVLPQVPNIDATTNASASTNTSLTGSGSAPNGSDEPEAAHTSKTAPAQTKKQAKMARKRAARAAVQADIQEHGTWQPVQQKSNRHKAFVSNTAQAMPSSKTKRHSAAATKGRNKHSTNTAANNLPAPLSGARAPLSLFLLGSPTAWMTPSPSPLLLPVKIKAKSITRTWASLANKTPTTAVAANSALQYTTEWPALGAV